MKSKLFYILAILILIIVATRSQAQPIPNQERKVIMPPDSLEIFSLKDVSAYLVALKKISVESYEKMTPADVVQDMYSWIIVEWNRKRELAKLKPKL